jgi:hypothetical protein
MVQVRVTGMHRFLWVNTGTDKENEEQKAKGVIKVQKGIKGVDPPCLRLIWPPIRAVSFQIRVGMQYVFHYSVYRV